ncbi:MAG: DUF1826 domain-containing protein [Chitinophagaceae bacterium]|nr:MAG: DUF1826 domain-containing protein [Chitinophagaceae bacterium]
MKLAKKLNLSFFGEHGLFIQNRELDTIFKLEVQEFMKKNPDTDFNFSGNIEEILSVLNSQTVFSAFPLLTDDICQQLLVFSHLTSAENFNLRLQIVKNNKCKKFHTDITDYRMLCTYKGPATIYLDPENMITESQIENPSPDIIRYANQGDVMIFAGALAEGDLTPVYHKSPEVSDEDSYRLLLKIDTNTISKWYK